MATWNEALGGAIRSGLCSLLSVNTQFADFWGSFSFAGDIPAESVFRALYRSACNREPPAEPPNVYPPAQCPAEYSWVSTYQQYILPNGPSFNGSSSGICGTSSSIFGPVTGPFKKDLGGGQFCYAIAGKTSTGQPKELNVTAGYAEGSSEVRGLNVSYSLCSGNPDQCGTPTPQPPPANYNEYNTNITYTTNDGTDITIPAAIVYLAPTLNVDAQVTIPVRVNFNDPVVNIPISIDADFNASTGDISFNIGGSNGGDSRGGGCSETPSDTDPIEPVPPPPPDSNSPDQPPPDDPETEEIIRALLVSVSESGAAQTVIFGNNGAPDAYLPDLGLVWFKVRVGGSSTAWLGGIRVQTLRQLIACDWGAGAIDYAFSARPGVQFQLTPIRARVDVPTKAPNNGVS